MVDSSRTRSSSQHLSSRVEAMKVSHPRAIQQSPSRNGINNVKVWFNRVEKNPRIHRLVTGSLLLSLSLLCLPFALGRQFCFYPMQTTPTCWTHIHSTGCLCYLLVDITLSHHGHRLPTPHNLSYAFLPCGVSTDNI